MRAWTIHDSYSYYKKKRGKKRKIVLYYTKQTAQEQRHDKKKECTAHTNGVTQTLRSREVKS